MPNALSSNAKRRTLLFLLAAAGCNASQAEAAPQPGPAPLGAPAPQVGPNEPQRRELDFEPARRFSPDVYADFAAQILPYEDLARDAAGAVRSTQLQALELDFLEDDWLRRPGAIVLLGVEGGRIVALTTRYYADIQYPDPRVISDGWGGAEIGAQYLQLTSPGEVCTSAKKCTGPRFRLQRRGSKPREQKVVGDVPVLEYRVFEDHDVALLYFPKHGSPFKESDTLGLDRPSRAIERRVGEASNLFGFEMRLVSSMSLTELRSHIEVSSTAEKLIKGALVLAAGPLVGAIAGPASGLSEKLMKKATDVATGAAARALAKMVEPVGDDWERSERDIEELRAGERTASRVPSAMPRVMADTTVELTPTGVVLRDADGQASEARLLGVRIEESARTQAAAWMSAALGRGQIIVSSDRWDGKSAGALVLLPGSGLVLNVELLRHGFARLDLEHGEVLSGFPLLVEAATGALEGSTGLGAVWREDVDYVAALASAK